MGGSSTQQAQANQAYNQQAGEQFYQQMVNNMFNRLGGQPKAPVTGWGNIKGPGADMSTKAWNPQLSPMARALAGLRPGELGGGGGGGGGGSTPRGQGKV